jgi:hypothetical protein
MIAVKTKGVIKIIAVIVLFVAAVSYKFELLRHVKDVEVLENGQPFQGAILKRKSTGNYYLIDSSKESAPCLVIDQSKKQVGGTNCGFGDYLHLFGIYLWYRNTNLFLPIDDNMKGLPEGRYDVSAERVEIYYNDHHGSPHAINMNWQ